jgi:hypothetical protein
MVALKNNETQKVNISLEFKDGRTALTTYHENQSITVSMDPEDFDRMLEAYYDEKESDGKRRTKTSEGPAK